MAAIKAHAATPVPHACNAVRGGGYRCEWVQAAATQAVRDRPEFLPPLLFQTSSRAAKALWGALKNLRV